MKLTVVSRSGRELVAGGLTVADGATTDDLKAAFHGAKPKFYPTRQRFTLPRAHHVAIGGGGWRWQHA